MPIEVKVPPMGESITEGMIAAWHVADGDYVKKDQHLFDLETDKVTAEGVADGAGRITLLVAEGDEVAIGQVIAKIDENAAPTSGGESPAAEPAAAPAARAPDGTPAPFAPAKAKSEEAEQETGRDAPPAAAEAETETETETDTGSADGDRPYSPAVRRIAAETGIDPATVKGTGKGGRVTKADMAAAADAGATSAPAPDPTAGAKAETAPAPPPAAKPAAPPPPPPAPRGERTSTRKRMTPLRRRIAERLVEAQQTAAILTTFNEADLSAVIALRQQHQEAFLKKNGIKLGFMSFFVKAAVHALREVPAVGGQIEGDEVVQYNYFDIGVAVSTPRGLLVPVVRDADQLGFAAIEQAISGYAKRAREGKITVDDLQGGIFTITNGGIFGSMLSTPILNQPQSGILGMHTIQERPVARDGQVVIRPMMYLALSYDHRLVDGREAVTFLVKIKEAIETPERMLLEV